MMLDATTTRHLYNLIETIYNDVFGGTPWAKMSWLELISWFEKQKAERPLQDYINQVVYQMVYSTELASVNCANIALFLSTTRLNVSADNVQSYQQYTAAFTHNISQCHAGYIYNGCQSCKYHDHSRYSRFRQWRTDGEEVRNLILIQDACHLQMIRSTMSQDIMTTLVLEHGNECSCFNSDQTQNIHDAVTEQVGRYAQIVLEGCADLTARPYNWGMLTI